MEIFVCNNRDASDKWLFGKACENAAKIPNSIHYMVVEALVEIHQNKIVRKLEDMKVRFREWEDAIVELPDTNSRIELCPLDSIGVLQKSNERYEKQFAYFPDFGHYPLEVVPGGGKHKIIIRCSMYPTCNLSDIWLAEGSKYFESNEPYMVSASFQHFSEINNNGISALIFRKIVQRVCEFVNCETITFYNNVNLRHCEECDGEHCLCLGEKTIIGESCPYYVELYLGKLKNESKA